MSELFDEPSDGLNAPEFSVSELSGAVKRMIEGEFSHIRIRGEVGRVSMPRSGHVYLDLKDDRAVIAAVIWKGVFTRMTTRPEEGMEVVATGRLTTFPGQSKYQMVIEDIKPAGMGALMAMLEKRKQALAAEGLFDPARKKQLPYLPEVIGVVTSPSGAVIRDILHRLRDRFPRKVLIWPVAVQGAACAPEVANAIRGFNALTPGGALPRPDLIIVARGGGSIEDLWGFNEEIVARAAAASDIPLISAVGHETDTTLIDFVSDMRAPTPTAAAELAVPVRMELLSWLDQQNARLSRALTQGVAQRGQRLRDLSRALPRVDTLLDGPRQRLDIWADRLPQALIRSVQMRRVGLSETAGGLRPAALRRRIESERRHLSGLSPRLAGGLTRVVDTRKEALARRADRLNIAPLQADLKRKSTDLARLSLRLSEAGQRQIDGWQRDVTRLDRLRETLGYKATLKRGYAVVRGDGAVVTTSAAAGKATALEIEFADGRFALGDKAKAPEKSDAAPKPKRKPPEQGSLF
jgi:exodeoxyribonuclease VII large subunit